MIDLHNHLLPGIDDGPSTMADAVEMARVAVREGITTMVCTPHVSTGRYRVNPRDIPLAVESMRTELEHRGVPLRILPGAEFSLDAVVRCTDDELRTVSLGGGGRWLLVELPFKGWPLDIHDVLDALELRGFGVVLAHPERNESVQSNPDRMRDLVGAARRCRSPRGASSARTAPAPSGPAETCCATASRTSSPATRTRRGAGRRACWRASPPPRRPSA
ncbi:MAG: CpsB/CapC family capsule biosynthesis tyrosine phosphatase [Thermoleophilia bacterium]